MNEAADIIVVNAGPLGALSLPTPGGRLRLLIAIASAIFLHAVVGAIFIYDERSGAAAASTADNGIPVEIIQEPSPDQPPGAGGGGGPSSSDQARGSQTQGSQASDSPPPASQASAAPATDTAPDAGVASPAASPFSPSLPAMVNRPEGPAEPPPEPRHGARPPQGDKDTTAAESEKPAEAKPLTRLPIFLDPSQLAGTSQQAAGNSADDDFRGTVFAMIDRAQRYPETARARQAAGSTVVTFSVDDSGKPANLMLARSSGQGDLDKEALDMVRRAAPFPPPPPGARRDFAVATSFGLK